MRLSDRDLELAKKHDLFLYCSKKREEQLTAFLTERDVLAIKEKDDVVRELMVKVAEKAFISGMDWQHDKYDPEIDKPFDLIVDEVLNETQ